jgi:hypothetical protein
MNVRLVLTLSLLGLLVGIASVTGLLHSGVESIVWCLLGIGCGIVLGIKAPGKLFLHGFVTGLLAGVLSQIIQVLFFGSYLSHNPSAMESFQRLPADVPPRVLVILLTPIVAGLFGVFTGFFAWAASRVLVRKPRPAA